VNIWPLAVEFTAEFDNEIIVFKTVYFCLLVGGLFLLGNEAFIPLFEERRTNTLQIELFSENLPILTQSLY